MKVARSRLVFINSSVNSSGKCSVLIPNQPFSVYGNECMRLAMVSFSLKRSLCNVNMTNNTFYAVSRDVSHDVPHAVPHAVPHTVTHDMLCLT